MEMAVEAAVLELLFAEDASETVRAWMARADDIATVGVAYAEARAAFARHAREGRLAKADASCREFRSADCRNSCGQKRQAAAEVAFEHGVEPDCALFTVVR